MNDNTEQTGSVNTYSFTLSFKVGGVVDSSLDLDGALGKLKDELTDFYGEDGFEVQDFHVATTEEIEAYKAFLVPDDDVTIN